MKPTTVSELTSWFEENFQCIVGVPRSCFTIPTSSTSEIQFVYKAFAVSTEKVEGAEEALVGSIWESFSEALVVSRRERPLLVWRCCPEFTVSEEQKPGQVVITYEQFLDGVPVPEGAVQDWNTTNWYDSVIDYRLASLYMRLCIPSFAFIGIVPAHAKPEGSPAERI
jgi:hypothetical protein